MKSQLGIIVTCFYGASALLGLPALAGAVFFGWGAISIKLAGSSPRPRSSGSSDILIRMLEGAVRVIGAGGEFLSGLALGIMTGLAVASLALLGFAVALFFTGRGLLAGSAWARLVATLLMVVLFGASALAFLSISDAPWRLGSAAVLGASVYVLWALWRG
jgi:hypothetical protein